MRELHESLLNHLDRFGPFRALVVGDFMLDQVLEGAAERLSPDAPVPVIAADESRMQSFPGGASNVATCLAALGGEVLCAGVRGADAAGERLVHLLGESGCEASLIIPEERRPTTVKRSIVGLAQHRHPQKMFRLDFESREPIAAGTEAALIAGIERVLPTVAVVCLEDYDKGACTPRLCARLSELCRRHGRRLLVDPAAIRDYSKYRGSTLVTPNRTEAELATGLPAPIEFSIEPVRAMAHRLLESLELEAVVLTLDRHGALLEERGRGSTYLPTVARTVYDVTGAGDMVLAALAAAAAHDVPWREAVAFANAAAGLEVEVFGARPIPLAQIRHAVHRMATGHRGKVRSLSDAAEEVRLWRQQGRRVVLTNGCFDLLHAGHVSCLRAARALGDVLVVGVNEDAQVRRMKGASRPIVPLAQRLEMLEVLECVDLVIPFGEPTASELLRRLRPDLYCKGGDYRPEELNEWPLLRELGIPIRLVPLRAGWSTTSLVARVVASLEAAESEKAQR